jgi:hypothetical protein
MTVLERSADRPNVDLTNYELRREIDRTLRRLFNPSAEWLPSEKTEVEVYFGELITEVLERLP